MSLYFLIYPHPSFYFPLFLYRGFYSRYSSCSTKLKSMGSNIVHSWNILALVGPISLSILNFLLFSHFFLLCWLLNRYICRNQRLHRRLYLKEYLEEHSKPVTVEEAARVRSQMKQWFVNVQHKNKKKNKKNMPHQKYYLLFFTFCYYCLLFI